MIAIRLSGADGLKSGEVLAEIKATGVCRSDEFTLTGAHPEGLPGREGVGQEISVRSFQRVTGRFWKGAADVLLNDGLRRSLLEKACRVPSIPLTFRLQQGYDHSYVFIPSLMDEHVS